jgi:hypothetical protein
MPPRIATTYTMLHHGVPPPPPQPELSPPASDDGKYEGMEGDNEDESNEVEEKEFGLAPTGPLQASLLGSLKMASKEENTRAVRFIILNQMNVVIVGRVVVI